MSSAELASVESEIKTHFDLLKKALADGKIDVATSEAEETLALISERNNKCKKIKYMNAIQALVPLRNDLPPLENSIIRMVMLVALAERAVQEDNQSIWLQNNDLNKRRATYHYDNHLQQMINYVGQIGCFAARTIKCGNSGLHKAELLISELT